MPQAARYKGRQKTGALRCLSPLRGSRAVGDGPGAARYALAPGYLLIAPSALILALQVLIVAEALVSRAGSVRASALIVALQVLIAPEARTPLTGFPKRVQCAASANVKPAVGDRRRCVALVVE